MQPFQSIPLSVLVAEVSSALAGGDLSAANVTPTDTHTKTTLGAALGARIPLTGVAATGGILPASVQTVIADVDLLRSFGFVGSGAGTRLSAVYSTLAAAQAVYPHAVALTDTLDWAAIQGLYNAVAGTSANGVAIYLPPGDAIINRTITTGTKAISVRGLGPFVTRIQFGVASTDLFQHGLSVQNAFAAFELLDLGLYCTATGVGYAINIRQAMSSGQFRLQNVRFASFSANFNWLGFVTAEGTTNAVFRDVQGSGGSYGNGTQQAASTQVGFAFNSPDNADRSFICTFDNCQIDAAINAIQCNITGAPGNSGSLEGFIFTNCGGRTVSGAWLKVSIPSSASVWAPPYYVFSKCNVEGPGTICDIDACSEFHMVDCLHYQDAYQSGTVLDFIRLGRVKQAVIKDNTLAFYASAQASQVINIGANSTNVTITGNNLIVNDPSVTLAGGILVDASASNVNVRDNRYISWLAGVPKEAGTTATLFAGGTNDIKFGNDYGTAIRVASTNGTIANFLTLQPAKTTFGPTLSAAGSDTNVPLNLQAQGASPVQMLSSLTISGSSISIGALSGGATITASGSSSNYSISIGGSGTGLVSLTTPAKFPGYAFASLPSVSTYNGCTVRVTDRNARLATSDGTNWRFMDGTIAS